MRLIGHLPDQSSATVFGDYLYAQGIRNDLEADPDGRWAVWVRDEEHLGQAGAALADYRENPTAARFQKATVTARQLKEQEQADETAARQRVRNRRQLFPKFGRYGVGPITFLLILASVTIGVLSRLGEDQEFLKPLFLKLPLVWHGEVWRLITPILIHFGSLHLLFNMLWLFDLGCMIEGRQGMLRLLLLVVVIGVLSNVGQYLFAKDWHFGGMSGVVYGLFGYCWLRGKYDPASGLGVHPQNVVMMIAWFFLCVFGFIPHVANTAHGVGLGLGMAWGALSSLPWFRRRPK